MGILTLLKDGKKTKELLGKYKNVKEFKSIDDVKKQDLMRPLLEQITFVFKIKSVKEYDLYKDKEFPDYVDILLIAPAKVYAVITKTLAESEFKIFSKEIAKFFSSVNPKVLYQMFIRTNGDTGKTLELLKDGIETIQKLNKVLPVDKTIFIKDLILTTLYCKQRQTVKELKRYGKRPYESKARYLKDAEELIFNLGEEYAFNAIRKEARRMYNLKMSSLKGEKLKNEYENELFKVIRLGDILLLKSLFDQSTQYPVLLLLNCLHERITLKEVK